MEEIQFNPQQFEIGLFGHNPIQDMSKAQINHLVHLINEGVKEGGKDIKSLLAIASKYQLLFSELEKTLKESAVDELLKYDKGRFEVHNVEMQVAEVGTKYDFSATKQWVDLQDQIDELKEKQKEVEKFCKSIKNKTITVDEETGESFEFYPPSKSSTTSIKKTIL